VATQTFEGLAKELYRWEKHVTAARAVCNKLKEQQLQAGHKLEQLQRDELLHKKASILLATVAEYTQDDVKAHFEAAGTLILQSIFGTDYSLEVELTKGSIQNSSLNFVVISPYDDDSLAVDPINDSGGLRDVVGFALRLAFLRLAKNRGVLFLDECFRQLSGYYIDSIISALQIAHKELGYQIILVTHDKRLLESSDKVITLEKPGTESIARE
jgi:DNA repair exonuclease SbcCD ATPase subunit